MRSHLYQTQKIRSVVSGSRGVGGRRRAEKQGRKKLLGPICLSLQAFHRGRHIPKPVTSYTLNIAINYASLIPQ